MGAFTPIASVAAPLPDADVDTDVIFPARFLLLLDKAGLGRHLFHERRHARGPTADRFILDTPPFDRARILVAGPNFGSGSSREQAVWALADFGIGCVIAPSFGEIFFANCYKNALLPIVLGPEPYAQVLAQAQAGATVEVTLDPPAVTLRGEAPIPFEIDPYRRRALMLGLDEIGGILADDLADIERFESRLREAQPWLFLDDRNRRPPSPPPDERIPA